MKTNTKSISVIKNWPEEDRPREKLTSKGAESLSTSELMAILFNHGTHEKSAVELAKEVLSATNNDFHILSSLSVKEMIKLKIKGFGPAKAITIAAAFELGRRKNMDTAKKSVIKCSRDLAEYIKFQLQGKLKEVFAVVFLNQGNRINHFEVISEGGLTSTIADPRIILKKALEADAVKIVLCHNHPSGNLSPSLTDKELTYKIKNAVHFFDIELIDHIIISPEGYYSFVDNDLL